MDSPTERAGELYEMGWKRSVNTTLQTPRDTTADRD